MSQVAAYYENIQDANRRLEWHLQVNEKLANWKQRAREAIGGSASIGLAVGGATATAASAAVAAAQGFVQGAQSALAENTTPPPPQPIVDAESIHGLSLIHI